MTSLRALWRLLACTAHVLRGALTCALVFPFLAPKARMRRVGTWSAQMLQLMGIALEPQGTPHPGPLLVVANHISWLDILAINAVRPVRFVSKADVRHWTLIGYLVASGGTLFIERERKRDAMRVVHQMAQALRAGDVVAVFPEGTTGDGRGLLPFHANLLQAAIATATPVQPVALRFADAASPVSAAVEFLGETTLVASIWRVARAQGLRVRVQLLATEATAHLDRRALSERLRGEIHAALAAMPGGAAAGSECAP